MLLHQIYNCHDINVPLAQKMLLMYPSSIVLEHNTHTLIKARACIDKLPTTYHLEGVSVSVKVIRGLSHCFDKMSIEGAFHLYTTLS